MLTTLDRFRWEIGGKGENDPNEMRMDSFSDDIYREGSEGGIQAREGGGAAKRLWGTKEKETRPYKTSLLVLDCC